MTTTTTTDALAGIIRTLDGLNTLSARDLGWAIAAKMPPFFYNGYGEAMAAFVERVDPDRPESRMGADRLAELIAAEFNLGEEDR